MNPSTATAICTPSRVVLALRDSTYLWVCLRRSLLCAPRSVAHLTVSPRALMNNPGYDYKVVRWTQVPQGMLRVDILGVNAYVCTLQLSVS
jgi:hypothetical protein